MIPVEDKLMSCDFCDMAQVYDKRGTHKKKFFVFQQRGNGILKGPVKGCAAYNRMVNEMMRTEPGSLIATAFF